MASKSPSVEIEVDDKVVRVSNPDRVYFPETGATKLDLVEYYRAVGPGIVNALFERPCMLHRFPKGIEGDKVHQKRIPAGAPPLGFSNGWADLRPVLVDSGCSISSPNLRKCIE